MQLTAFTADSSLRVALVGFFFLITTVSQSWPPPMFILECLFSGEAERAEVNKKRLAGVNVL
jgi:hypothetical protein